MLTRRPTGSYLQGDRAVVKLGEGFNASDRPGCESSATWETRSSRGYDQGPGKRFDFESQAVRKDHSLSSNGNQDSHSHVGSAELPGTGRKDQHRQDACFVKGPSRPRVGWNCLKGFAPQTHRGRRNPGFSSITDSHVCWPIGGLDSVRHQFRDCVSPPRSARGKTWLAWASTLGEMRRVWKRLASAIPILSFHCCMPFLKSCLEVR